MNFYHFSEYLRAIFMISRFFPMRNTFSKKINRPFQTIDFKILNFLILNQNNIFTAATHCAYDIRNTNGKKASPAAILTIATGD